ncbi:hypothetical protein YSY43_32230 [Paenibacillus sp. YSY-4.3]
MKCTKRRDPFLVSPDTIRSGSLTLFRISMKIASIAAAKLPLFDHPNAQSCHTRTAAG